MVCGEGVQSTVERGVEVLSYLSHGDGVSCSTSSHMWGSWHFPRFLFWDGSLTQMYIASFMVLTTPCAYLSTIVKHSKSTGVLWSGCVDEWGMGLLDVS